MKVDKGERLLSPTTGHVGLCQPSIQNEHIWPLNRVL